MLLTLLACVAIDGDTLRCGDERVRLLGLDAPELHTCRKGRVCVVGDAVAARDALARLIVPGVTITRVGQDRYGRTLALIYARNRNVGCALIAQGNAEYVGKWDNGRRLARDCGR